MLHYIPTSEKLFLSIDDLYMRYFYLICEKHLKCRPIACLEGDNMEEK